MVQKYSQPYCLAKYMKLYIAVCCDIAYGTAAPSCGLLVYEQFYTVLKRLLTLAAEIPARWRCQHTFPDSGGTTFRRFLTKIILFWMVSAIFSVTRRSRSDECDWLTEWTFSLTWLMWLWWVMIPIEDFTDVILMNLIKVIYWWKLYSGESYLVMKVI